MYTLFIDTHNNTRIVIFKDEQALAKRESNILKQSTIIIPLIKDICESCNLQIKDMKEIIVVNGPGSFTGVRLGVTIAKTISYVLNIPIKFLNSLEMMAMMDDYNNEYYGIKDAKGVYLAQNKNSVLELSYLNNSEINQQDIITDFSNNYENIFKYKNKLTSSTSHLVNPVYIKKIEVQK